MKKLVIIPAFNEEKNILGVVRKLQQDAPDFDYIVINDDLELCVKELHAMIEAARNEPVRRKDFIARIREEMKDFRLEQK